MSSSTQRSDFADAEESLSANIGGSNDAFVRVRFGKAEPHARLAIRAIYPTFRYGFGFRCAR
jgi:hypothetical protein